MRISIRVLRQVACSAEPVDSKVLADHFLRVSPCVLYGQLGEYADQHIPSSLTAMRKTKLNVEQDNGIPAVFLDRDGTIIEDRGDLSNPSQVAFFKDTVSSLCWLSGHFALFLVTNQPGVAKGTISMQDVDRVNSHISSYLSAHGVRFLAIYVCPHERLSACPCIKPNPYFLKKAERDFGVDLGRSFVIGDHPHDVELARNARANAIYVLSGHGMKHRDDIPMDTEVAGDIREAAEIIRQRVETTQEIGSNQRTNM
jgi:histidinol-phosphate phosphatase family protein